MVNSPANRGSGSDRDQASALTRAKFRSAFSAISLGVDEVELLPAHLARASAQVLDVDGVGIGIIDDYFRVPLGASDDVASFAERLQFTAGEGPCLRAVQTQRPVCVRIDEMEAQWPEFTRRLLAHTPYQAVMSLPFGDTESLAGALDLYVIDPARLEHIRATDTVTVIDEIWSTLIRTATPAPGPMSGKPEPRWMHGEPAQTRLAVWIAIGELMTALDISDPDALALLRAQAFIANETVEQTAQRLNDGVIDADQFTP